MRHLISFLLLCCSAFVCQAQTNLWYKTEGFPGRAEGAWTVDCDPQGNVYWAVQEKVQWPYWYFDVVVFSYDSSGISRWTANPWGNGTGFNDIAFVLDYSDDILWIAGRTDSTAFPTSGDALLMKYNPVNGNHHWSKNLTNGADFGYQEIDDILVGADGLYLSGWTTGDTTDSDFLLIHTDTAGNKIWETDWDYDSLGRCDGANGAMVMDHTCLYVAGHVNRTNLASLDGQMGLACFSRTSGVFQWEVTWGGLLYDDGLGMCMSEDSMLYVTGYTGSYGNGSQTFINKFDRNGNLLWSRLWGGSGTEDCRTLVADGDSIVYVVGITGSYGNGLKDIFVLKYNDSGTLIDSLIWGGNLNETAHDAVLAGRYLYISGETESFGNGSSDGGVADALLLKIDAYGMNSPDTTITISTQFLKEKTFSLWPNPASQNFTIKNGLEKASLMIYNISGELVYTGILTSPVTTVSCSELPEGLYLVCISGKDFSHSEKISIVGE